MTELAITFYGTSAAVPTGKRGLSSIGVTRGADLLLFDCGEGTQRQMMKAGGLKAPSAIFITHHHGDHWGGLPGLLMTLDMMEHDKDMPIYVAPDRLGKMQAAVQMMGSLPSFAHFEPMDLGRTVSFNKGTTDCFFVRPFETVHCPDSRGYVLEEPERPGRFDPRIALLSGIEPGPDFKRLQNGETVLGLRPEDVIGPARPGRKVAYTGDTAYHRPVAKSVKGVDVLIHEATFSSDDAGRAAKTRHSTGMQAGMIAAEAGVGRCVLTHFSPRSDVQGVVFDAKTHCAGVPIQAAHDGMRVNVPLAP